MSAVQDLRREIREFIQHPRRLSLFLGDQPNWNMLASSFDTVADTGYAIETYEGMAEVDDTGMRYLLIYGLLQALYVQQDAVESMVRAFEPSDQRPYRIEDEEEAEEIRRVRNRAVGHPTVEGNAKSRKNPGVQMSHSIIQTSMHKDGFILMTNSADGSFKFSQVTIPELIQKNRTMVERVLRRIKGKLEAAEMEHRKHFRQERLTDMFPETLGHYFAKIFEGTGSPASAYGQFAKPHVQKVADVVRGFREALNKRGSLTSYEEALAEVEYPLGELQKYFDGTGSLQDARAARIFGYFIRDRIDKLAQIAAELDKEY